MLTRADASLPLCAQVVLADVDVAAATAAASALTSEGLQALAVGCDVRSKQEVEALVARTVEWAGALDILVANAGEQASA